MDLSLSKIFALFFFLTTINVFAKTIDDNDLIPPSPPFWEYFTINGVDSDQDGVRDDVELWINENFDDTNVRRALKQMAKAYALMLKHYDESDKYIEAREKWNLSSYCQRFVTADMTMASSHHIYNRLTWQILNNPWRKFIDRQGERNMPSGSYRVPDVRRHFFGLACNFQIRDTRKIMELFLKRVPEYKWTEKEQNEFKDVYENPNHYDVNKLFKHKRRDF